jgi:hypothetical protein
MSYTTVVFGLATLTSGIQDSTGRKPAFAYPEFRTQRVRIPALESHFNGLSLFGMGASFVSEIFD